MGLSYYWSKFALMLRGKSIRGSALDRTARINYGSNVVNSKMGRFSYCGYDCWIIEAEIGAFCSISNNVRIGGPSHPVDWVSTSPVFHKGRNMFGFHYSEHEFNPYKRTKIGNDVWIGENAMIKAGVTIGDGAVVGMGSVVTKDIGPYEIWIGNPAKMLRTRFNETTITELLNLSWWNLSDDQLVRLASHIDDVRRTVEK